MEEKRYPDYDKDKADLLICPITGKPILRAKGVAGGEEYVRSHDLGQAFEQGLERGGNVKIWIAK